MSGEGQERAWICGKINSCYAAQSGRSAKQEIGILSPEFPGKPQQNAFIERYNRTVRYDWLGQYLFESIAQVQEYATRWLWTYNNERTNMALGGITPKTKLAMVA